MKRELAFALEVQSQFTCFLGRTRSSKNSPNSGSIIDNRTHECNGVHVYKRNNKRFKSESESVAVVVHDFQESEPKSKSGAMKSPMCEEGPKDLVVIEKGQEIDVPVVVPATPPRPPRRFTRSALTQKEEEVEEVGGLANGDSKIDLPMLPPHPLILPPPPPPPPSVSGTPTKKMELKMSKKIELKEMPTTLRGLLETGLLDGHTVFYNFSKKGINMRGVIKGVGILCSCTSCNGSTVISPSQFEMHACRSYRHARKFICFENGNSLDDVMNACKRSALETLEETIQTLIGLVPVKESSVCQNCKGPCASSSQVNMKQLCDSCINLDQVEVGPTITSSKQSGTSKRGSSESANLSISSGRKIKKLKRSTLAPVSHIKARECDVSHGKSRRKMTKKSSQIVLIQKSPVRKLASSSLKRKRKGSGSKRVTKSTSAPKPSRIATLCKSTEKKNQSKITKKDQKMHWLIFEEGGLPDGSEVAYYSRGKKLLEGYKKGYGIFCFCCSTEVSPSQFEAHAGWASRKKPYGYIYTSNGVSLHEYAISLVKNRSCTSKENDELCAICFDGGNLLLCDGCPRAFHKECASLSSIPRGKWYCKYCQNMFHKERFVERNENALAAGRVAGIDPIEQITQRCIRIVKSPEETESIACVLCRSYDYSKSGFDDRIVILCDQCEKEYHIGCLKKHKMAYLEALPDGDWFCCLDCVTINSVLGNLLTRKLQKLPDTLMPLISEKKADSDFNLRWSLLSGKIATHKTRLLLSQAVAIFHECFDPIIDKTTGCDYIPSMVYGRNIKGQDFGGVYCTVLTIKSKVVSAGIIRIFGQDIAELPLVATSKCNQGKGYFQLLFSCIMRLLSFLKVKKIVLPSAEEAESIWTNKFGFSKIPAEELEKYRETCSQMVIFQGTSMLEKPVPEYPTAAPDPSSFDISLERF